MLAPPWGWRWNIYTNQGRYFSLIPIYLGLTLLLLLWLFCSKEFFFILIFFFQLKKNQRNFSIKKNKMGRTCIPKGQSNNNRRGWTTTTNKKKKFQYNRRQITNSLSTVTSVYFVIKWNVNNSVIDSTTICEEAMNQSAPWEKNSRKKNKNHFYKFKRILKGKAESEWEMNKNRWWWKKKRPYYQERFRREEDWERGFMHNRSTSHEFLKKKNTISVEKKRIKDSSCGSE